jgi:hypothetical protein
MPEKRRSSQFTSSESFFPSKFIICRITRVNWMKTEEAKALATSIKEMNKDHADTAALVRSTTADSADPAKKLWKSGNKSLLVKAGIALLVFPEPIVSDMLGTALLAAGTVQEGIKRQSIYLDDLPKAFKNVMKDLKSAKELL